MMRDFGGLSENPQLMEMLKRLMGAGAGAGVDAAQVAAGGTGMDKPVASAMPQGNSGEASSTATTDGAAQDTTTTTTTAKPKKVPWWKEFQAPLSFDEWKSSDRKGVKYHRNKMGGDASEDDYKQWLEMKKKRWQGQVDDRRKIKLMKRGAALPEEMG